MTDFVIFCIPNPGAREADSQAATYRILVGGDEAYRGHLLRHQGRLQPSRFESLAAGYLPFEISQNEWVGLRRIDVREAFAGARIGELRGGKLYFDEPNRIVGLQDPAPLWRRALRTVGNAGPKRIVFRRALDRLAIGWIENPPPARGHWPGRILRGSPRTPADAEVLVWRGQLDGADLDIRPFLAAAMVLHGDRDGTL